MFIEKNTVIEFYHKLQKLVSQREASNEIDLSIIQNEINQLIDKTKKSLILFRLILNQVILQKTLVKAINI